MELYEFALYVLLCRTFARNPVLMFKYISRLHAMINMPLM
jgi:hypothetical protein